jgi:hypothetical protein
MTLGLLSHKAFDGIHVVSIGCEKSRKVDHCVEPVYPDPHDPFPNCSFPTHNWSWKAGFPKEGSLPQFDQDPLANFIGSMEESLGHT